MAGYVPQRGDLIAVAFDPQSGHERKGRRSALVIRHYLFNRHTGLALVCPITTTERSFPFHVAVAGCPKVSGFVRVEQVKSIDFRARSAKRIAKSPPSVLEEVLSILDACLY
ncbi:MAG: type II toxin-antitoxin system PemK/MazF family toxin [Phycisphaerae bacterium]|nr:type II toxin-antitoxin system PemK/MazF family toxin [Phycisphaerae bacterium]